MRKDIGLAMRVLEGDGMGVRVFLMDHIEPVTPWVGVGPGVHLGGMARCMAVGACQGGRAVWASMWTYGVCVFGGICEGFMG